VSFRDRMRELSTRDDLLVLFEDLRRRGSPDWTLLAAMRFVPRHLWPSLEEHFGPDGRLKSISEARRREQPVSTSAKREIDHPMGRTRATLLGRLGAAMRQRVHSKEASSVRPEPAQPGGLVDDVVPGGLNHDRPASEHARPEPIRPQNGVGPARDPLIGSRSEDEDDEADTRMRRSTGRPHATSLGISSIIAALHRNLAVARSGATMVSTDSGWDQTDNATIAEPDETAVAVEVETAEIIAELPVKTFFCPICLEHVTVEPVEYRDRLLCSPCREVLVRDRDLPR
jgi:hypothetical protein